MSILGSISAARGIQSSDQKTEAFVSFLEPRIETQFKAHGLEVESRVTVIKRNWTLENEKYPQYRDPLYGIQADSKFYKLRRDLHKFSTFNLAGEERVLTFSLHCLLAL